MKNGSSPYHRRIAHRLALSKERNLSDRNRRFLEIDRFALSYEQAYFQLHRVPTHVEYARGWYFVHGQRIRHSTLERMTNLLLAQLQEIESPNPDSEV